MILKIVKLDVSGIELQLSRIADVLEGLIKSTDPISYDTPATDENTGVFYSDDEQDIVSERLIRMGRSPKK